jgi:8-oxo-dGTP diphosphatase
VADVNLRVAAKAVIVKDGKVLIVREASTYQEGSKVGQYGLVGGRIDPEESFYDALSREVMEEVNLTIRPIRPAHVGEWWPEIKGIQNHIVAIFMECSLAKKGSIKLSEEHDDYAWVDMANIKDYQVMEPDRTVVINFLKSLPLNSNVKYLVPN